MKIRLNGWIKNSDIEKAAELLGIEWVLSRPEKFRYQLLGRIQMDCDYYLGNGQIYGNHLWMGNDNLEGQIAAMKLIWHSFTEKPEWLTLEQIEEYETKMLGQISLSDL